MSQPLIGITASRIHNHASESMIALNEAYSRAVARAAAIPVTIPLGLQDEALIELLSRLDGVLFSGGGDVETSRYHGVDHPRVDGVDPDRDRIEILLVGHVVQRGIPFLGICRGIQVINVALGGTLFSDVADQHGSAIRHDCYPDIPRDYPAHEVELAAGSRLAQILGVRRVATNSLHHQAVRQLVPGLTATAYAPDNLVEACEIPDHPFGLAVQWHPEWMPDSLPMQNLFRSFTSAAAGRRGGG